MTGRKIFQKFLLGLILGISVFALLGIISDLRKITFHFLSFNLIMLIPILFLSFLNYFLRFLKWQYYLRFLKIECETSVSLKIFLSGLSMTITPGKIGELLKAYFLKEIKDVPFSKSVAIVISERFTDVVSLVLLCFIGLTTTIYGMHIIIAGLFFCFLFIGSFSFPKIKNLVLFFFKKFFKKKEVLNSINEGYEIQKKLLNFKPLIFATVISAIAWFSECAGLYFTFNGFENTKTSLQNATFIYSISTLAGAFSMIPGGFFATEASLTALINEVFKITSNLSLAITITTIIRICTLWFAVIIGLGAFLKMRKYLRSYAK